MNKRTSEIRDLVKMALKEDIGNGDITSLACLEPEPAKADVVAKSDGILSGLLPFSMTLEIVDSATKITPLINEGEHFGKGDRVIELKGFNVPLLAGERVALNFLAHLSGIATLTGQFAEQTRGTGCRILDTRKTTPGWRQLEKAAVLHGGGENHRMGLYDMILIKDNHIAAAGSIEKAVTRAREYLQSPDLQLQFGAAVNSIEIEVEVTNEKELAEAIGAGVNRLLLDNQTPETLTGLVKIARGLDKNVKLEASGNVSLDTVRQIAETGVDYVSAGALTHSAPVSDFSMKVVK